MNWAFFAVLVKRMAALSFIVLILLLNFRFGATVYGGTQPAWIESLLPTALMASVLIGLLFLVTLVVGRFIQQEQPETESELNNDHDAGES